MMSLGRKVFYKTLASLPRRFRKHLCNNLTSAVSESISPRKGKVQDFRNEIPPLFCQTFSCVLSTWKHADPRFVY